MHPRRRRGVTIEVRGAIESRFSRMWLWCSFQFPMRTYRSAMTKKISKSEAREAARQANEKRVARELANVADVGLFVRACIKHVEVHVWEMEILSEGRIEAEDWEAEARKDVAKRLADSLGLYGRAVKRLLDSGEKLENIADRTGLDVSELRSVLPYAA